MTKVYPSVFSSDDMRRHDPANVSHGLQFEHLRICSNFPSSYTSTSQGDARAGVKYSGRWEG